MRRFLILVIVCLLLAPLPAQAFFQKKDYKQMFLNEAISADKRNSLDQAFHSFEKAVYYYPKDRHVLEEYAKFLERRQYFDKAEKLYQRLFVLTKDQKYLFESNLCTIKNGKSSSVSLGKIFKNTNLTSSQKNELNKALIYHYSYKQDWGNVKNTCDKLSKKSIGKDLITTCIVASEKKGNKKDSLGYYLRFYDLYPNNSETVNKIISVSGLLDDFLTQEKFIKKLSALNPKDNGIKYRLAGLYEKYDYWANASKVYEALMAGGDKSEHVKTSYAYAVSQINKKSKPEVAVQKQKTEKALTKTTVFYPPKPLSGYKLDEKLFYKAWSEKKYDQAQEYLSKMLAVQPKNVKLLKHRVDIYLSQKNYSDAIDAMNKLKSVKSLSKEDEKILAFLYSKNNDYMQSIAVIESLINKYPKDKDLNKLALEYSMAGENWDKAIFYNDKILSFEPKSEKSLKQGGDLYSIKHDFANAIKYYEKLVESYPKLTYKMALANLYMANKDFECAQDLLIPIYNSHPEDKEVVDAYLNSLLAQQKTKEAYWVIQKHNLGTTKEGFMVLGDLAMEQKCYEAASRYYMDALRLDSKNIIYKNKLAYAYRMSGCLSAAAAWYKDVLLTDSENLEAMLGLGSLEIDKKNFKRARQIFECILREHSDYRPAKIAIAHSYISNDDKFAALDVLGQLAPDDESTLMKAQIYYDMNMLSDSKSIVDDLPSKGAKELKYKIRRDNAITVTPVYSFFFQQLSDEFKLDYHKFGTHVSQNVGENAQVFMDYNVIIYSSGGLNQQNNVVNEFRCGAQGRPTKKWAYKADIGVKAFEFGGAMLNTDSWLQYFVSDKLNLKVGYRRDNIEQSYLSAVGGYIDGVFTGRAADNKFYVEGNAKLPHQFYTFARGGFGTITEQNIITNQYYEGMFGIGRLIYNNPRNKWINTFAMDLISYNSGYQFNLLKIYDSTGKLFGNYFSPTYFTADTLNFKVEGFIKPWKLKYGIKAFGGIQTAISPDQASPTWGVSPYITYDINDNVAINALYNHFTYEALVRDQFIINVVIRGFRKNAKK